MSLKHAFVSAAADGSDATKLRPSNWNAAHVFDGGALGSLLMRDTGASDGASWVAAVAAGSYLRSAGVGAAPVWSTLTLPNTATAGDLIIGTAANVIGSLADVAAGSVLVSGGVGVAPAWSATPTLTSVTAPTIKAPAPVLVDSSNTTLGINAMAQASDGYLYVTEFTNGSLAIYSLKNPAKPVFVSRVSTSDSSARSLVVRKNTVYVVSNTKIQIIDVTNKTSPTITGSFSTGGTLSKEVVADGNNLYVAINSNPVQKWSIDSPTVLTKRAQIVNDPNPNAIAVANGYVFTTSGTDGQLTVFTRDLTYVSTISVGTGVTSLAAKGGVLYALRNGIIYVYDTSNPAALSLVTTVNTSGIAAPTTYAVSIAVNNDKLFAVVGGTTPSVVDVLDISVPSSPTRLYSVNANTGTAGFIAFYNHYAYVTGHFAPLTIDVFDLGEQYQRDDTSKFGTLATQVSDNVSITGGSIAGLTALGIGTTSPGATLHSLATTEQLRVGYDASNYNSFTVGSTGSLTIAATGTNPNIILTPGGTGYTILNGNVGIGTTGPTAVLHLKAGTATANTAPLKLTSGVNLTTPEIGAIEFVDNGTTGHLYITQNVAGVLTRVQIA